jgi:uncharacterized coiled-coil protein SlyX
MITDEELSNLPEDPEAAFIEYERLVRMRALDEIQQAIDQQSSADPARLEYISHVIAAAEHYQVPALKQWQVPGASENRLADMYQNFVSEVNFAIVQMRLKRAQRSKRYSVRFDPSTKELMRHHLRQIREIVDKLEVNEWKKNRLHARITALEDEISRDRTRFEVLMALVLEGSRTAGKAADNLGPVTKRIKDLVNIFGEAKEQEDTAAPPQLPAPEERKRIEPPKKVAPPKQDFPTMDDEIPF